LDPIKLREISLVGSRNVTRRETEGQTEIVKLTGKFLESLVLNASENTRKFKE
jgi:hypothetical protein